MNIRISFEIEPFNESAAVIKCNSKDDWKKYSVTFTADEELESDGSGPYSLQIQATVTLM